MAVGSISIESHELEILLDLLEKHLEGVAVWAYGSRVRGTSHRTSDLDLVAFGPPEKSPAFNDLKEALEESDLPFIVDIHLWSGLPESFKQEIQRHHIRLL